MLNKLGAFGLSSSPKRGRVDDPNTPGGSSGAAESTEAPSPGPDKDQLELLLQKFQADIATDTAAAVAGVEHNRILVRRARRV